MEYVLDGLFRSGRPGYASHNVPEADVANWLASAKEHNIQTILCLLPDEQLAYYAIVPGGLLNYYQKNEFEVIPRPVADHRRPPVPEDRLAQIYSDFLAAAKPMLVHCSAGIDRTGAVVTFLRDRGASAFFKIVESCMLSFCGGRGEEHFRQVTRLALRLYDLLAEKRALPPRYRTVLWAAAMLHDIGTDPKLGLTPASHAWRSARYVREKDIHCDLASSTEIATVAALHRREGPPGPEPLGALCDELHDSSAPIPAELVRIAAILRAADGLDRYPDCDIASLRLNGNEVVVEGSGPDFAQTIQHTQAKAALLLKALGVTIKGLPLSLERF